MERIEAESKVGYYDTYHNEQGEVYLVLGGLDVQQIHTPGALESFLLAHYDSFALAYWGLALATFTYLIGSYLVIPLYVRLKQGLPFFVEQ